LGEAARRLMQNERFRLNYPEVNDPTTISSVMVRVDEKSDAAEVAQKLRRRLKDSGVTAMSSVDVVRGVAEKFKSMRIYALLLSIILWCVSFFVLKVVFTVLMNERKSEFALLRVMGAPRGYLGGLALSGPLGLWDSGLGAGLGTDNVVLAGVRDIDPPEADLIEGAGIPLVGPGEGFAERLGRVVDGRPVYIHIDCDVLEPGIVPTDYLVGGGLSLAELRQAAEVLARGEVVGIQIGELETATGEEDLDPLLDALSPVLDAVG